MDIDIYCLHNVSLINADIEALSMFKFQISAPENYFNGGGGATGYEKEITV